MSRQGRLGCEIATDEAEVSKVLLRRRDAMLRIRYLYAEALPPAPKLTTATTSSLSMAEAVSRHLERVGTTIEEFGLRRELLASSSRLAERGCEIPR